MLSDYDRGLVDAGSATKQGSRALPEVRGGWDKLVRDRTMREKNQQISSS
jgi:hypothetical protein